MATYGYIRKEYPVPTTEQLKIMNEVSVDEVFIENSPFIEQDELKKMLLTMKSRDCIVVYNLRTFAQNFKKFKELLYYLSKKKIDLISLEDDINTIETPEFYEGVLAVFRMEEEHFKYQVKESVDLAKANGKEIGRPKIKKETILLIQELAKSKKTLREIADICNVSLGAVHKYVNKLY